LIAPTGMIGEDMMASLRIGHAAVYAALLLAALLLSLGASPVWRR
jgi:hypothetical protein